MLIASFWLIGGLSSESLTSTWVGLGLLGLSITGPLNLPVPEMIETVELSMDRERKQMPGEHPDKAES